MVVGGGNGAWRRERRGEGPGLDKSTLVKQESQQEPKHPKVQNTHPKHSDFVVLKRHTQAQARAADCRQCSNSVLRQCVRHLHTTFASCRCGQHAPSNQPLPFTTFYYCQADLLGVSGMVGRTQTVLDLRHLVEHTPGCFNSSLIRIVLSYA